MCVFHRLVLFSKVQGMICLEIERSRFSSSRFSRLSRALAMRVSPLPCHLLDIRLHCISDSQCIHIPERMHWECPCSAHHAAPFAWLLAECQRRVPILFAASPHMRGRLPIA